MTQHDHREPVVGCYRCELNEDELGPYIEEQMKDPEFAAAYEAAQQSYEMRSGRNE